MDSKKPDWLGRAFAGACVVGLIVGLVWHKANVPRKHPSDSPTQITNSQTLAPTADPTLPLETPAWSPAGPDLTGRVTSTNGEPVLNALVLIDSASPRVGRGYT